MRYRKHMVKLSMFLLLSMLLVGCQADEADIRTLILTELEERYAEKFEIVDFNYNKTYHVYEAGVHTEKTQNGYAAEVNYSPKAGLSDEYYAQLYCAEVSADFDRELNLTQERYVYSTFPISMMAPQNERMTYEEYKEFMNLKDAIIDIELYYVSNGDDMEEVRDEVSNAAQKLGHLNCDVDVYFVEKEEISDIQYFVTHHYKLYDENNLLDRYEYVLRIKKRDGKISG